MARNGRKVLARISTGGRYIPTGNGLRHIPAMEMFDIMTREVCASRRINTNTPLQALVTLNDSTYMEAAINMAKLMERNGGDNIDQKIRYAYRLLLFKDPEIEKLQVLISLYDKALNQYANAQDPRIDNEERVSPEDRSLALVANALLNIDEVITKN